MAPPGTVCDASSMLGASDVSVTAAHARATRRRADACGRRHCRRPGSAIARGLSLLAALLLGPPGSARAERIAYPWPRATVEPAGDDTIAGRIATSLGYSRVPASPGSFAVWLRELPLRPGRPDVLLFDGRTKANQTAHHSVIDIDVGRRDLQQCADAVIRLRAEYLYSRGCEDTISFRFTSGDPAKFADWRAGLRPRVDGNRVTWAQSGRVGGEWRDLRSYLDVVFTYAGSYSLERELAKVSDPSSVQPGDVFIQGGFPGHAVIVVDVARNDAGQRQMLLAQSYMPAQQIHVLQNPSRPDSPWYDASSEGVLLTPEWRFASGDLRRFPDIPACPTDLQAP